MTTKPKEIDPLGLDDLDPLPTEPSRAKSASAKLASAELTGFEPHLQPIIADADIIILPRKEPDALVLVIRRMTCTACHNTSEAPEDKLFLRTKGHFQPTLQDESFFNHLPRETKVLHLPAPRCGLCFS